MVVATTAVAIPAGAQTVAGVVAGKIAAIIPAETAAMTTAELRVVDRGAILVPVPDGARMATAVRIAGTVRCPIILLKDWSAIGAGIATETKIRMETRTGIATVPEIAIKIRTKIVTEIEIVAGTGIAIRIRMATVIAIETGTGTRTSGRITTVIATAIVTIVVIGSQTIQSATTSATITITPTA